MLRYILRSLRGGSPSFTGTTLNVPVSYSGGCGTHTWRLCWNGIIDDEGIVPEISVKLEHDSGGDLCEAWISEDLTFDGTWLEAETGTPVNVNIVMPGGSSVSATLAP